MRLARDQFIQRKLREEILALGPYFNAASVQKLEYLDAVIREGSVLPQFYQVLLCGHSLI